MNMPLAEVIDRYTILRLKVERIGGDELEKELAIFEEELRVIPINFSKYVQGLLQVNSCIWDLESDIRKGKEGKLGLEEVGRRAIAIRDYNKQRIMLKNEITKTFGVGFIEVKHDHVSE